MYKISFETQGKKHLYKKKKILGVYVFILQQYFPIFSILFSIQRTSKLISA